MKKKGIGFKECVIYNYKSKVFLVEYLNLISISQTDI